RRFGQSEFRLRTRVLGELLVWPLGRSGDQYVRERSQGVFRKTRHLWYCRRRRACTALCRLDRACDGRERARARAHATRRAEALSLPEEGVGGLKAQCRLESTNRFTEHSMNAPDTTPPRLTS